MPSATPGPDITHVRREAHPTAIGRLLRGLFGTFNVQGIEYAVLRNADGLPDYTRNDVDILVAPKFLSRAAEIVRECAKRCGWRVLASLNKFEYRCEWLFRGQGDTREILQVDIVAGVNFRRFPFANPGLGLAQRAWHPNGFWVVPAGFEAAVTVVKELLAKGQVRPDIQPGLQQKAGAEPKLFCAALSGYLSDELIACIQRATAAGDWTFLSQMTSEVRRQVKRGHFAVLRWVRYAVRTARHYLNPPLSCFAVFIGPDGSGKSSVVEALAGRLLNHPFKIVRHGKSNFGVLPPLKTFKASFRRLLGRKPSTLQQRAPGAFHSGMIRPNPLPASLVYVAYYALDAFLGRFLLRRWRGQCALILFDRYFYDYYYQIGNRNTPRWYLRFCEMLVPRPDLVFLLDRDPSQIFAQKPELTPEEIGLQQNLIRAEFGGRPGVLVVNARHGLEATVRTIEHLIVEHLVSQAPAD